MYTNYRTDSVISKDGTVIGYRILGQGPGLVLVHGSMMSSYNYMELAGLLSDSFTIYIPDRRNRGMSGPYINDFSIKKELEDLEAVLIKTNAHQVFGLNSGAIIGLQSAVTMKTIEKLAVYEPPIYRDNSIPATNLNKFDLKIREGKLASAMLYAMKRAKTGPAIIRKMPKWLSIPLIKMVMKKEEKNGSGGYELMKKLGPLLHYDLMITKEVSGTQKAFESVRIPVLLLGGTKSPAYLKELLSDLESNLPNTKRVELPGLNHTASWNAEKGGNPAPVAFELRKFFSKQ